MPITGINWKDGEGYDIHLLRGNRRLALRDGLEFTKPGGATEDAASYLANNHDVALEFRPSFRFTLDFTPTPPICVGFGITVNDETGQIDVDPPPEPNPAISNFIVEVTATDSTDGKIYRTSVRVHLHNRVTSAWLTPPLLTLRPTGAAVPLPEQTEVRFSIRAQFDDGTVGDITRHPNIIWRPTSNVAGSGFLIIDAGNTPSSPAVRIDALLPPDLKDFLNPNPPEIVASGHVRFAVPWASDNAIRTETVQIQDAWPGTINPESVPNFLFLCDGYKADDKPRFEAQVTSLVGMMKTSGITRPFDLLSTSTNCFRAFVPSNDHGISVLCEVYPQQDSNGNVTTQSDGTVNVFCVPDPEEPPSAGNWSLANVIHKVGLPIPKQASLTLRQVRDYWDSIVDGVPHAKISDGVVRHWKKLVKRTFIEETDSVFGLAYGDSPSSSREADNRMIGFHPRRMTRSRIDPILGRLTNVQGTSMGDIWVERSDGTRPNSYRLVFIFSSLKWDRGVNYGRSYIAMNVEDRDSIPARPVSGKPTYAIDLTGTITNDISYTRLIRACHELAHSFGLGDEYNEKGTLPQSTDLDTYYGNLQKHSDIEDGTTHRLDGDQIKWRWHRIRKAAVIAGPIVELGNDKFRIPLVRGQDKQFAVGDTVLLRIRQFPNPLPRRPNTSDHLVILPPEPITGPPPAASIVVRAKDGHTFTFADAEIFSEGCIVYLPVPAKPSVRSDSYPFAELIAKNIKDHISSRNRALNQDPAAADPCVHDPNGIQQPVKLTVDLPFCFKHKNQIVGLFTGGKTFDCGVYHPTGSCIMRNSNSDGKEFCAVCRYILVDIIDPFKHFTIDLDYEDIYPQT